jgi:hypothetical protein
MLLIRLASCCVMGHGFGGIGGGCSRSVLGLEPVSEPESWWIRRDVSLIRLASCCVMDHGFGCIAGVLFSNGSRLSLVLVLFSNSELYSNFEPVSER